MPRPGFASLPGFTTFVVFAIVLAPAVLTPASARADLTADQVWQNLQVIGAASGQSFTPADIRRDGPVLMLSDIAVAAVSPNLRLTGVIPRIDLRENGDGTVSVTLPDRYDLTLDLVPRRGGSATMALTVDQQAARLTASGTPEAPRYAYSADQITARGDALVLDGTPTDMRWSLVLDGFTQDYDVTPGDPMGLTLTSALRSLEFTASGTKPGAEGAAIEADLRLTALAAATDALLPATLPQGASALIAAGGRADFSATYDAGRLRVTTRPAEGAPGTVEWTLQGGNLRTSLDANRLTYGLGLRGAQVFVTGAPLAGLTLPPLASSIDEAEVSLRAPLQQSDTPQDFALGLRLRGLTLPPEAWAMIDPGAILPRDPATVGLDLGGTLRPLRDPLAPMGAPDAGPPVEVHSLDINSLQLSLAGAELGGNGALTFDNSQPRVLSGIAPLPQGRITLSLTGATALMGKLMELGFVDQTVAMGFGLATAMFARPGEAPDSFVSDIEARPDGLFANGQPLPFDLSLLPFLLP